MPPQETWKILVTAAPCVALVACGTSAVPNRPVGSAADVKAAQIAVDASYAQNASDHEWLLNQIGLRCVRNQGGFVPDRAFTSPPSPKPHEDRETNAWLSHEPLSVTKGAQKFKAERQRQNGKPKEQQKPKLSTASQALLTGPPTEYFEQTSMDGTPVNYVVSGCVGKAVQKVFGVPAHVYYATDLKIGGIARMTGTVTTLPALKLVEDRFKDCMKQAGHVVEHLDTPPEQLVPIMRKVIEEQGDIEALRRLESRYDEAAQACKKQERVAEIYAHHYLEAVKKATKGAQSAIAAHKEMMKHAERVHTEYLAKYHS